MAITSFHGEFRWLSNFWPALVTLDGKEFPSVEHAYQAAKTFDIETRERFANIMLKPGDAKRMGRRVNIRPDWESVKLEVMLNLLREKFKCADMRKKLLATGDAELTEGNNWNDTFWGVCNGRGNNHLGKLLMQVRNELRERGGGDGK